MEKELNNLKPFFRPFGGKRQSRAELTPRGVGREALDCVKGHIGGCDHRYYKQVKIIDFSILCQDIDRHIQNFGHRGLF